jgi:hypothetical protein
MFRMPYTPIAPIAEQSRIIAPKAATSVALRDIVLSPFIAVSFFDIR